MKKYMIICVALVALLFASCKNEDIFISREVTFNLNPYTIVKDFAKHEVNSGDLTEFGYAQNPNYFKLRTYLLVYDDNGYLVASETSDLENFTRSMNVNVGLDDGTYTVVAISHIINVKDNILYWIISGTERLNDLKLTNNDDYYDYWIKLLGATCSKINVCSGHTTYNVDIMPAGALVVNYLRYIHYFEDMIFYQPYSNKEPNTVSFNNDGSLNSTYDESTSLSYAIAAGFAPSDYTAINVYWYYFFSPMDMTNYQWLGLSDEGDVYSLGNIQSADIKAGKMFLSTLDLLAGTFKVEELYDSGSKSALSIGGASKVNLVLKKNYTSHIIAK